MFKPSQGKHTPVLAVYSPQFLEKPNTRRVPMGYQILPTSSYLSSYVLHMFFICSSYVPHCGNVAPFVSPCPKWTLYQGLISHQGGDLRTMILLDWGHGLAQCYYLLMHMDISIIH